MNIKLINPINPHYSAIEQVLTNRGIPHSEIHRWLNTTDADINDYKLLGEAMLLKAAKRLVTAVGKEEDVLVIVDSDCDGFTSAALLINYLYDQFPAWVQNHVKWFIHSGKQHGLSDVTLDLVKDKYSLIITPDASSNDYEYHLNFLSNNIDVIVMDHHEADIVSPNAIVLNNQLCAYPNKFLSGVGVTWQFCRYFDNLLNTHYADSYLDLVALGNTADMMSLREPETKHLIIKGFRPDNIHNPFIAEIAERNAFSIGDHITPHGASWFIAPFVNAMVRSGEADEKELLFNSFLKFKAFNIVPSTKRGHKPGETEQLVTQAVRTCTNVKRRQTQTQDETLATLEGMIEQYNLLDNKVLMFLLEPGQVDKNVAGLVANKFMAKYQRPVCILTKTKRDKTYFIDGDEVTETYYNFEGSARGCDAADVTQFKDMCEQTNLTEYVAGHQGAFGIGIRTDNLYEFIEATNGMLKDMPDQPIHYVDYLYRGVNVNPDHILDIASLNDFFGKDVEEAIVGVSGLQVSADMINVYKKKNNTLKITLPNKVAFVLFDAPDDLCDKLSNTKGTITFDIVGECAANEYNGWVTPQIKIKEYEITGESRFNF